MKKLLIVQSIIPSYRVPLFKDMNHIMGGGVTLFADMAGREFGVEEGEEFCFERVAADWKTLGPLLISFKYLVISRQYSTIFHVADFKYLTLWFSLMFNFFSKKNIYIHGQGGYKRSGVIPSLVYSLSVGLCDGYICYCNYSLEQLKKKVPKFMHKKLHVCENTLYLSASEIDNSSLKDALMFIGRLRERCGIESLLEAARELNIVVNIVGTGDPEYVNGLKKTYSENNFYGAVYDFSEQQKIAKNCFAGAYFGDAGLSVVNYMALGLPVIVHSSFHEHMGPEPSYVKDGLNGLFFCKGSSADFKNKIDIVKNDLALRQKLAVGASDTFKKLSTPSMGEKMVEILRS